MTRLLLVDGSNMVMRAAFGGDVAPDRAVPVAIGMIRRACRELGASHLVIAMDSEAPSWRKSSFPEYKANRSVDTAPWLRAAYEGFLNNGWYVSDCGGYEADDIIATLAHRGKERCAVTVLSGDSDLLPLTAFDIAILKPLNGGKFDPISGADVCGRYQIANAGLLVDLKAMAGEHGDNIPGVPGIGPIKAAKLLQRYGPLELVIRAGIDGGTRDKDANAVAEHAAQARQAYNLISLVTDAPVQPIKPNECFFTV